MRGIPFRFVPIVSRWESLILRRTQSDADLRGPALNALPDHNCSRRRRQRLVLTCHRTSAAFLMTMCLGRRRMLVVVGNPKVTAVILHCTYLSLIGSGHVDLPQSHCHSSKSSTRRADATSCRASRSTEGPRPCCDFGLVAHSECRHKENLQFM